MINIMTEQYYNLCKNHHKSMWKQLAQNPTWDKEDYFAIYPALLVCELAECWYCFACLVANNYIGHDCHLCPLTTPCFKYFYKWVDAKAKNDLGLIVKYANKLANIPWKSYKEWRKI